MVDLYFSKSFFDLGHTLREAGCPVFWSRFVRRNTETVWTVEYTSQLLPALVPEPGNRFRTDTGFWSDLQVIHKPNSFPLIWSYLRLPSSLQPQHLLECPNHADLRLFTFSRCLMTSAVGARRFLRLTCVCLMSWWSSVSSSAIFVSADISHL